MRLIWLNLVYVVLCIWPNFACSSQSDHWEIRHGRFYFSGIPIATQYSIAKSDLIGEASAMVSVSDNILGDKRVLQIIYPSGESEYWVYRESTNQAYRIDVYPTEMKIRWIDENRFELVRKHMGRSVSILYSVGDSGEIIKTGPLNNVVFVDLESNYLVLLEFGVGGATNDYLKFVDLEGNGIGRKSRIRLDYDYYSSALDSILSVTMSGKCRLQIEMSGDGRATDSEILEVQIPDELCSTREN